jgi:L-Ala-D/L-Glu epimerase
VKARVRPLSLRLRAPLETAWGALERRELRLLEVESPDGAVGVGEAAPLEPYDGVSLSQVDAALSRHVEVLAGAPPGATRAELLEACRAAAALPQALAAVDLALWDLEGRHAGRPVAALLAGRPAARVAVNATIGATDRRGAAGEAVAARARGFSCVKVKVGVGDDAGRLAAVRAAAGADMALRIDANGAWSVEEALDALEALAPVGLELVEEPVRGLAALRALRSRVAVRVAMDETAGEPGAPGSGAADAVCLKVSRCGGISGVVADAEAARAAGSDVYVASTFDGPVGIAAALHAAAAIGADAPCGLATLAAFDAVEDPFPPRGGFIPVPAGPGLGADVR